METMALATILTILLIPNIIYLLPFMVGADSSHIVVGSSMVTLQSGDIIIVRKVDPGDIEIGDIVTVSFAGYTITHRVIEIIEAEVTLFKLKGEANEQPDASLYAESQLIGKVIIVFPFSHLYTPYGFALALVAPFALIISRLRSGRTPMRDESTLLLFAILALSAGLTISHYFVCA
jgi:signal peptidase